MMQRQDHKGENSDLHEPGVCNRDLYIRNEELIHEIERAGSNEVGAI